VSEENLRWFTVVKVPLLRVAIGEQVLLYTVTGRVGFRAYISYPAPYPDFVDRVLETMRARDQQCVERIDEATLYDYFTGEELPIHTETAYANYAFQFQWVKKAVPIKFIVHLKDRLWRRERVVEQSTTLETYSLKAGITVKPPKPWEMAYDEEVQINGVLFRRIHGLFTSERTPFVGEDLEAELARLDPGMPYLPMRTEAPKRVARRRRLPRIGYARTADLLDLLKLVQRGGDPETPGGLPRARGVPRGFRHFPTPRPGRE
jgi:hypothetical protein